MQEWMLSVSSWAEKISEKKKGRNTEKARHQQQNYVKNIHGKITYKMLQNLFDVV